MPSVRTLTVLTALIASTAAFGNVTPRHLVRERSMADASAVSMAAGAMLQLRERCSYQTIRVWDDYPRHYTKRRVRVCWRAQ